MTQRTYTCTALTDIWTGDAERKPDRLITTGLLGSIRWWFEVLVRGLGGSACDPCYHKDNRAGPCPQPGKKLQDAGHHCVVCELFGCTGWARKFRFEVLDENGKPQQNQIKANQRFQLRFTPLRAISEKEWALLDLTLRLIADYGAIGGKTVLKNRDYGRIAADIPQANVTRQDLERCVENSCWRSVSHEGFEWASVTHYWLVEGRYLNSNQFNQVVGGKPWLRGSRGTSKKVFSFKNPPRTFGFVRSRDDFDEMLSRLKGVWPDLEEKEFLRGCQILDCLIPHLS